MTDKSLVFFADKINEIYQHFNQSDQNGIMISAPRIVLVGTQSSGKSTLVNRMIGLDMMPIGDNMVTRTPVNVRLHYSEKQTSISISTMENGELREFFRTSLQTDIGEKIELFRKKISECTDNITKTKFSISDKSIFVDIQSNKVTNFSFVDLPGQVAIACDDRGQSDTLILEIEELIKKQIIIPNTIVLTVVQSKTDLETDIGLALIKKLQKQYKTFQTIGVITKPDLLDNFDKLNDIVSGNISKSVMLDDGYFVVNNKTESARKESEFFNQKFDCNKEIIIKKRYGISNLMSHLQTHLITSIKQCIPSIKTKMIDILKEQRVRSQILGIEIKDQQTKTNYFGKIIYQLNNEIINSLESHGNIPNIGQHIRKIIDTFVKNITCLNPFSESQMNNEHIINIIDSFNGYHLTSQVSLEQIVERCITDKKIKPIMLILPVSIECVNNIVLILENVIDKISKSGNIDNLESYPKLKNLIVSTLLANIKTYGENVVNEINKYLIIEENFFWSTSIDFKNTFNTLYLPKSNETFTVKKNQSHSSDSIATLNTNDIFKYNISLANDKQNKTIITNYNYDVDQVRTLSTEYYKTIIARARDYIVKIIIVGIIKKMETNINNDLNQLFANQSQNTMSDLFVENTETVTERINVSNNITKLEEIIQMLNSTDF